MASCSLCDKKAVMKTAKGIFCSAHFIEYFEKKVLDTIEEYKLFTKQSKVIVGVSGGKDSLTIIYILKKYGYNPHGLIVDEGIANYRQKTIDDFKEFAQKYEIDHYTIVSFKEAYGDPLDDVVGSVKGAPCSQCGIQRRELLNKHAAGYDVIVTGHNLDDEVQSFMMNMLKGGLELAARHGPRSGLHKLKGFVPRVKPLYFCTEKEVKLYSFLKGLTTRFTECPYCPASFRHNVGVELNKLEVKKPGSKEAIIRIISNYFLIYKHTTEGNMKQVRECCLSTENVEAFCMRAQEFGATEVFVLRKLPDNFNFTGLTVRDIPPTKFADVSTKDLRKTIESARLDFVIGIEGYFLQQKGKLNQVLCKLLHERKTAVFFSTEKLLSFYGAQRARLLKHIGDALELFEKYNVEYFFCAVSDDVEMIRGKEEKESLLKVLKKN